MKVIASMMIAGVSAQFYPTGTGMGGGYNAYPASYGMSTGFGYGGGFGGFGGGFGGYGGSYGGGYGGGYGDYGRECRKGVTSDDLNGYARCYCDKNHRDDDPCNALAGVDGPGFTEKECQREDFPDATGNLELFSFGDYYDDVYDEDCVERSTPPTGTRRCPPKLHTEELPSTGACWCDSSHKKDPEDVQDQIFDCFLAVPSPEIDLISDDEVLVSYHYQFSSGSQLVSSIKNTFIRRRRLLGVDEFLNCLDDIEDEFNKFDPNCIERYNGNYGGFGMGAGFGGFNTGSGFGGFNTGFGGNFGGNWGMQMQAPATSEVATTTAPQFNFGQQFGNWGYPAGFQQWGR